MQSDYPTFRAFQICLGSYTFIAAAEWHRSDSSDPTDHYRVNYAVCSDLDKVDALVKVLRDSVERDEETDSGFVMRLSNRGKQSTARLGKMIMAHIYMDLCCARVVFSLDMFNYFQGQDSLTLSINSLVACPEEEALLSQTHPEVEA